MPPFKSLADRQADRAKSLQRQSDRTKQIAARHATAPAPTATPAPKLLTQEAAKPASAPLPPVAARVQQALIPLFRDDSAEPSAPSSALVALADLYLHAAQHRTRHVAMVWPATLKTLTVVHALATLARWHEGDKLGVRGLLFPVKSNAFHPLNHIHFERKAVLGIARSLEEVNPNPKVTRSLPTKDAFHFWLTDRSLPKLEGEAFNPTIGELLPHFLAPGDFKGWQPCHERLLALIRAKVLRRTSANPSSDVCSLMCDWRGASVDSSQFPRRSSADVGPRPAYRRSMCGPRLHSIATTDFGGVCCASAQRERTGTVRQLFGSAR